MKVSVLIENSVGVLIPTGLVGEHGLSLWIEVGKYRILFDTGQTGKVVENAIRLGIDLKKADCIVLSHGHYDHTGGLKSVLEYIARPIEVFAHPGIFDSHWVSAPMEKYIGIPFAREELESLGARFNWIETPTEVFPNVFFSGEIPRKTPFERVDDRMFLRKEGTKHPDPIKDDASLFVKTEKGLVILLGCAHSGVINTVEHAKEVTGEEKVYAIIGGTHLGAASGKQLDETLVRFAQMELGLLAANHCTGLSVAARFKEVFGSKFRFGATGEVFEL